MNTVERIHQEVLNSWHFDEKIHQKRQFKEAQLDCSDIKGMGLLTKILRNRRYKNKISITHLSFLLECSRTQYRRMEKGENNFSDCQLEVLSTLYGDDITLYKDSQEIENLLKRIGYYRDPNKAVRLLKLTLKKILMDKRSFSSIKDLTLIIPDNIDEYELFNEKKRKDGLIGLIKKLEKRLINLDSKMTEIGNILMKMKDSPEREQIPFREKFHLLEDEQISIHKLISKLQRL